MPRDGSNVYVKPFPDVIDNTTIESVVYNGFVNDVANDLNNPRPILAGGTAANNARDAMLNLKGEIALQNVVNYDSHLWVGGSFYSAAGATAAPNTVDAFVGEYYANAAGDHATIHARANTGTPFGTLYVRQKVAGIWGAWAYEDKPLDDKKVNRSGDVMTGDLAIDSLNPALILDKAGSGNASYVLGTNAAKARWRLDFGDASGEGGTQTGSNFVLRRYNNDGVGIDNPITVSRETGAVSIPGALTVNGVLTTSGTASFSGTLSATTISATSNLTVGGSASIAGTLAVTNDLTVYRSYAPTSGYIFLGNTASKYFGFNGTRFDLVGGELYVHNGGVVGQGLTSTGALSVGTTANIAGATTIGGTATMNGALTANGVTNVNGSGSFGAAAWANFVINGSYPCITFHYPSTIAVTLGVAADGNMYLGGASFGSTYWLVYTSRNLPSNEVTSIRFAFAGDQQLGFGGGMQEPFGVSACATGSSGLNGFDYSIGTRYRQCQYLINGGWYNAG